MSDSRTSRMIIYSHGFRIGDTTSTWAPANSADQQAVKYVNRTRVSARFLIASYTQESSEEAWIGKQGTLRYVRNGTENGASVHVDGVLEAGQFRLSIVEGSVRKTLFFQRDSYDYTTMECPEIHLGKEGESRTMRLLDLETLEVVRRHYTWIRSEDLEIDGTVYRFRVIDFKDKNKKCRRWVRQDGNGVMIGRQDGKGKSGSYSVRLVQYQTPGI